MRDLWHIFFKKRHRVEDEGQENNSGKNREATKFTSLSPVRFLHFITVFTVVLKWGAEERVCWQTLSHWKRDRLVCICSGSMPHWVSACRWKWLFVIINPGNEGDVCPHSLRHAWLQSSSTTQQSLFRSEDYQKSCNALFLCWHEVLCISAFNKVFF